MKAAEKQNPFIPTLIARNLTVEIHHHSAYQLVLANDMSFGRGYARPFTLFYPTKARPSHFAAASDTIVS
jgi:hypothetical protein